jgi:hypothetical protein
VSGVAQLAEWQSGQPHTLVAECSLVNLLLVCTCELACECFCSSAPHPFVCPPPFACSSPAVALLLNFSSPAISLLLNFSSPVRLLLTCSIFPLSFPSESGSFYPLCTSSRYANNSTAPPGLPAAPPTLPAAPPAPPAAPPRSFSSSYPQQCSLQNNIKRNTYSRWDSYSLL